MFLLTPFLLSCVCPSANMQRKAKQQTFFKFQTLSLQPINRKKNAFKETVTTLQTKQNKNFEKIRYN